MTAIDIRYGRRGGHLQPVKSNPDWESVSASCGCPNRSTAFAKFIGTICETYNQIIARTKDRQS